MMPPFQGPTMCNFAQFRGASQTSVTAITKYGVAHLFDRIPERYRLKLQKGEERGFKASTVMFHS
jgi:hypothetical protein